MHDYLRGFRTDITLRKQWQPAAYTMVGGLEPIARHEPPVLETGVRANSIEQVELLFPEKPGEGTGFAVSAVQCQHGVRHVDLYRL